MTIAAHPEVRILGVPVRDAVWQSVLEQRTSERVELLAACLMPDHLHLLAKPGEVDLITWMQRWKSWSTRLAWNAGHRGPLWQPSTWDRSLRSDEDLFVVARYIFDNPESAGLIAPGNQWNWRWGFWLD
ncbi:MAG: transposase [bacterium]